MRLARNLRQIDLARQLGVAQTTIANYEQKARFPDEGRLRTIAKIFDVSLDYLLGLTDVGRTVSGSVLRIEDRPSDLSPLAHIYLSALLEGKKHDAFDVVLEAVRNGTAVRAIYQTVIEPALAEIGRLWEVKEIDVSREHYASRASEDLMGMLYRHLERPASTKGTIVAVSAEGDAHEIGIKMIADLLEESGWSCYYIGANTPPASIERAIVDREADVLAISATVGTDLDSIANLIAHIRESERVSGRRRVAIVVGGRRFRLEPGLEKRVGADGFAGNVEEALLLIRQLTGK